MKWNIAENQETMRSHPLFPDEPAAAGSRLFLLLAGLFLMLFSSACALPPTSASGPGVAGLARTEMDAPAVDAQVTPAADLPAHTQRPDATSQTAVTLPAVATPTEIAAGTAVLTPTAVLLPTATSDLPSPTPSPTPMPSPTATRAARSGGAHVVREALADGVYCPMRETFTREEAEVVGYSAACDLPIVSYRVGEGETALVLVGGIHGGYEWNTVLLATNTLNHLRDNPQIVPGGLSIYVIPNANPDGFYRVFGRDGAFEPPEDFSQTVSGRFNGRDVDLNRNWGCRWQAEALWGNETVSGGTEPFSEPETRALRDFLLELQPTAVLFWHSAAVGVYPSGCDGTDPASAQIAQVFAEVSGYEVYDGFSSYAVTGEAGDWLTTQGIPAITVELSTHSALDWEENLAGLQALLAHLNGEEN